MLGNFMSLKGAYADLDAEGKVTGTWKAEKSFCALGGACMRLRPRIW